MTALTWWLADLGGFSWLAGFTRAGGINWYNTKLEFLVGWQTANGVVQARNGSGMGS